MRLRTDRRGFSPATCIAAGILALTVVCTPTAGARESEAEKLRARRQRQATNAREFVSWLSCSKEQAHKLLFLVEEAADLHIQAYESTARLLPEIVEAYGEFAEEDRLNQGFSPDVERRAASVHHKEIEDRDRINKQLVVLEQQAASLLTSTQLETAQSIHPGFWRSAGVGAAKNPVGRVQASIAWKRWRSQRRDRLDQAIEELGEHSKKIHPRMGRLGRHLLHPAAAEILCSAAGFRPSNRMEAAAYVYNHGTREYPIDTCLSLRAEATALQSEINNWNLINGLNLTAEQMTNIVGLYHNVAHELQGTKKRANKASGRHGQVLFSLERQVEQVLNPGQRQVLADYKPCLLPPKDLKNPVRAGQANDSTRTIKWLTRARTIPKGKRADCVERLMEREAEHFGDLPGDQWNERADLLMRTIGKANRMSDVDFEISKEQLARKIERQDIRDELKSEINSLARERGLPGVIAQHMLKPKFIEQLQQRAGEQGASAQGKRQNRRVRRTR